MNLSTDPLVLAAARRLAHIDSFNNMPSELSSREKSAWYRAERKKLVAEMVAHGGDYVLEESRAHHIDTLGRTHDEWAAWWVKNEVRQRFDAKIIDADPLEHCPHCGQTVIP